VRGKALEAVTKSGERLVLETPAGTIGGLWRGHGAVDLNDVLDVELELPRSHDWSEIDCVRDDKPNLWGSRSDPWLEGIALDVDELGVLTLDVAGAILLVDTTGDPPDGIVGERVRLRSVDLEFHPVGL
jgi:hypothetical protein